MGFREKLRDRAGSAAGEVAAWAEGRIWWWRAPLLLFGGYIAVRHAADPLYTSIFGGLDLGIHEAGHLVLGWAPQFLTILGGTLFQCAAPVAAAALFVRQPDWFAVPFCGVWLADNLYGVAAYMGDARALELPLVSVGGGEVDHDWNYLLDALGLLEFDTALAAAVRALAFAAMALSLAGMGWVLWTMARAKRRGGAA